MAVDPKLSPDDAVVVFADLQTGILDLPMTRPATTLMRSAQGLARLAEIFDIPTIALCIPKRAGETPVISEEITGTRTKLRQIQRFTPDSFQNREFVDALEKTGRKTLVLSGVATEVAVHWLTVSGIANGYQAYVVADACGGVGEVSEAAAYRRFEQAGAVMTSVVSLASEFSGNLDMTKSPGKDAVEVIYQIILGEKIR
ncbi:isochorismatase family protein [Ramlibacter sp.]|uniref:isochorismatase family protein n=1 Tax=Ramlibacter sp. TaxID=1917967 RepID=UPI003D1209A2